MREESWEEETGKVGPGLWEEGAGSQSAGPVQHCHLLHTTGMMGQDNLSKHPVFPPTLTD